MDQGEQLTLSSGCFQTLFVKLLWILWSASTPVYLGIKTFLIIIRTFSVTIISFSSWQPFMQSWVHYWMMISWHPCFPLITAGHPWILVLPWMNSSSCAYLFVFQRTLDPLNPSKIFLILRFEAMFLQLFLQKNLFAYLPSTSSVS